MRPTKPGWTGLFALALFNFTMASNAATASAADFGTLLGSWDGSGTVNYQDRPSESVHCNAYYTGSVTSLHLAIRCQSASSKIEIRGSLSQHGDTLSGQWEERTFNSSGEATGRHTGTHLSLSITGGGFTGTMSVDYGRSNQSISVSTSGIPMTGVKMKLSRSG